MSEEKSKSELHGGHRKRLRDRFLQEGADSFAYHNLVELLLFYAIPRRDTNELAHRLCERFPTLESLLEADASALMDVKGIGEHTAVLIRLIPAIAARLAAERADGVSLNDEETVRAFLSSRFTGACDELTYVLLLDGKRRLIDCLCLGKGTPVSSAVNVRALTERAMQSRAVYLFLAHNHPAGDLCPSEEDLRLTRRLSVLLRELDLSLCEHYLFTENGCLPLKRYLEQNGRMN
ncbi:MAG: hypothetical protein E7655_05630 [Ruminococcaceae bacterium]|nr:hypothetical protein [Oscillospiraceae bacterium]